MTEKTQGIFVGNRLIAGTPTPSNFTKKVVRYSVASALETMIKLILQKHHRDTMLIIINENNTKEK